MEYLLEECYKAESTARDYLNAMSECKTDSCYVEKPKKDK